MPPRRAFQIGHEQAVILPRIAADERAGSVITEGEIEAAGGAARNGLASRSASAANRFNFQYAYLPETEEPVWEGRLLTNVGYYHD